MVIRTIPKAPPAKVVKKAGPALPSMERAEKGLSLLGLLKQTPPYIKYKARDDVIVKRYDPKMRTKGGYRAATATCVSTDHRPAKAQKQTVIGLDKSGAGPLSKQKRLMVSCTCEFFLFYCEYALWTWGAATIKFSNGEPAVVRNPGNIPMVCKHLVAVLRTIKEQGD